MNKRTADRITSIVMIAIASAFLFERNVRYPANVFPAIAIILLVLCSIIILIRTFLKDSNTEESDKKEGKSSRKVLFLTIGSFLYLAVMNVIGFYVTSSIYMGVIAYFLQTSSVPKKKRFLGSLLMSLSMMVFVYLLFRVFLKVPTPQGLLI